MSEKAEDSVEETKQKILRLLETDSRGFKVDEIRKESEIGSWSTTIKHALELVIENQISGKKTRTGWVFWIESDES